MRNDPKLISVVIPVFNEAENITWFYKELSGLFSKQKNLRYELIYVNDGSKDKTPELLRDISAKDPNVVYVCLARNFGKEAATTAGIHTAKGDAIIILDGDGQHPPEIIPEMLDLWKQGAQQVVGIRTSNNKAGFLKTLGSRLFYTLSHKLGASNVVANATDFRLIDRELADAFARYNEKKRMTRALLDWSGFETTYVPFEARDREHGTANYSLRSLTRLAIDGYVGATLKPLYFVGAIGLLITLLASVSLIVLSIEKYALNDPLKLGVSGSAIAILFVTMLVGVLMVSQGIVAAYVANIHVEAQNRPLYIINKARSKLK